MRKWFTHWSSVSLVLSMYYKSLKSTALFTFRFPSKFAVWYDANEVLTVEVYIPLKVGADELCVIQSETS